MLHVRAGPNFASGRDNLQSVRGRQVCLLLGHVCVRHMRNGPALLDTGTLLLPHDHQLCHLAPFSGRVHVCTRSSCFSLCVRLLCLRVTIEQLLCLIPALLAPCNAVELVALAAISTGLDVGSDVGHACMCLCGLGGVRANSFVLKYNPERK